MIGRQSKRHKGQRTHIERAVVGVPVGSIGLTATESDGEIAALIEVILLIKHTVENLRQRGSYLAVAEILRQRLIPRHQCERLHGSHTVGCGTADNRESAFGRYKTFEHDGHLLRTFQLALAELPVVDTPTAAFRIYHILERFQIHGMEDITAVIVESECTLTIREPSVAHIPFLRLADGHVDAEIIVGRIGLGQKTLDGGREQQPVGVRRIHTAQTSEFIDVALLGGVVERHPQSIVGTDETLSQIGSVHQCLSFLAP